MDAVCKVLGVRKGTSVAYRPESQGTVERQNRTLIKDLTKRLEQYGKTWVDHLAYAEWSFNTTPFSKTGMSPYFIFFGREPPVPSVTEVEEEELKNKDLRKYVGDMKRRVKEIHQEARDRMTKQRAKDELSYNKKAKHLPYKKGELVYEKVQDKYRNKLQPRWSGPIEVIRRRPSPRGEPGTTYVCQKPDGTKCERNYEQLKKTKAHHEYPDIALKPILKKDLGDKETLSLLPIMAVALQNPSSQPAVASRTRSQTSLHDETADSAQADDTLVDHNLGIENLDIVQLQVQEVGRIENPSSDLSLEKTFPTPLIGRTPNRAEAQELILPNLVPQGSLKPMEVASSQAGIALEILNPTQPTPEAGITVETTNCIPDEILELDRNETDAHEKKKVDLKTTSQKRLKEKKTEVTQQMTKVTRASIKEKSLRATTTMEKCLHEVREHASLEDEDFRETLEKDEVFHDSVSQVEESIADVFVISSLMSTNNSNVASNFIPTDCNVDPPQPKSNRSELSEVLSSHTVDLTVLDLMGDPELFRRRAPKTKDTTPNDLPDAEKASTSGLQNITPIVSFDSPSLSVFSQALNKEGEMKTSTPTPLSGEDKPEMEEEADIDRLNLDLEGLNSNQEK
jgi:hypothetical protein